MKYLQENNRSGTTVSRSLSLAFSALLAFTSLTGWSGDSEPGAALTGITVYKTPNCGCCTQWAEHMEENGFDVNVEMVNETQSLRSRLGVPNELASCHTAVAGDYWIEGHVPADLVSRLLSEHPADIKGISAPGMPLGSPGMEAPNASTYQVVSLDDEGNVEVYAVREGEKSR